MKRCFGTEDDSPGFYPLRLQENESRSFERGGLKERSLRRIVTGMTEGRENRRVAKVDLRLPSSTGLKDVVSLADPSGEGSGRKEEELLRNVAKKVQQDRAA